MGRISKWFPPFTGVIFVGLFIAASFLLGDVQEMNRFVSVSTNAAERQKRWFFYGQDTWRVTNKLTLNYGLRWEIYFPETVNAKGNGGFANPTEGIIRIAQASLRVQQRRGRIGYHVAGSRHRFGPVIVDIKVLILLDIGLDTPLAE